MACDVAAIAALTLVGAYAHVIRSDEDRVRSIVSDSLGLTAEDWLRTG
jgi:hypothetical protein